MSLARKTVGYLSIMGGTQVVQFVLQLASAAVLGRLLAPDDYGVFAMASVVMGIGLMFRELGLRQSAIRAEHLSEGQEGNLVWVSIGISLACAAAVAIGAPIAQAVFREPEVLAVTMALVVPTFLGGVGLVPTVKLARDHRFVASAAITLGAAAAGMAAAVALAFIDAGVWALVGQVWVAAILTGLGPWLAAPAPMRFSRSADIKGIVGLGAWLASSSLLWQGGLQIQRAVLGALLNSATLGQFSRARDLTGTPLAILRVPFATVGLPVLSSVQTDEARFRRALVRLSASMELVLCLPIALLIACSSDGILLLLGDQWEQASTLAPWLACLLLGAGSLSGPLNWILVIRGRGKLQFAVQAATSVTSLAALVVGLVAGGALGAVLGLLAAHVVGSAIRVRAIVPASGIRSGEWAKTLAPLWLTQIAAGAGGYVFLSLAGGTSHGANVLGAGISATLICAASLLLSPTRRGLMVETWKLVRHRSDEQPALAEARGA